MRIYYISLSQLREREGSINQKKKVPSIVTEL
nr:MAG TPA: hypothetical protein [Caudoviricetes sp.]